jgi:hypothetical protein
MLRNQQQGAEGAQTDGRCFDTPCAKDTHVLVGSIPSFRPRGTYSAILAVASSTALRYLPPRNPRQRRGAPAPRLCPPGHSAGAASQARRVALLRVTGGFRRRSLGAFGLSGHSTAGRLLLAVRSTSCPLANNGPPAGLLRGQPGGVANGAPARESASGSMATCVPQWPIGSESSGGVDTQASLAMPQAASIGTCR